MIALLLAALSQPVLEPSVLGEKVEYLLQHHAEDQSFEQEVDFLEWWYLQPARYRHNLGRDDATLVAELLSKQETTLAGAAILFESPASLRYATKQIDRALARETARRKALKRSMLLSSLFPAYHALRCLKHLENTGKANSVDCGEIAGKEEEYLSKQT